MIQSGGEERKPEPLMQVFRDSREHGNPLSGRWNYWSKAERKKKKKTDRLGEIRKEEKNLDNKINKTIRILN